MLARTAFSFLILAWVPAARISARYSTKSGDPVRLLYEFPYDTYVENLAVRPNGQILVTPLNIPQLWLVEPDLPGEAFVAYEFPGVLGLTGIVEYQPDVFAVVTGNFSVSTGDPGLGTWAIWSIDLGGVNITSNETTLASPPRVRKITTISEATALNGLSVLSSAEEQYLIVGDVKTGVIYSAEVETGEYAAIVNNTYTEPAPIYGFGTAATDGIKVVEDVLYFGNCGQGIFVKTHLNASDGTPVGDFEVVATKLTSLDQWDDFTFDCEGKVFIAAGGANTVQRIDSRGSVKIIAGNLNSTAIAEATATKFGRRENDDDVLYVTTAGGVATPVDGTIILGGQVLAIEMQSKGSNC
ncbi:hypothetical protein N0V93_007284 [Gnomoniopsis smithogilvyi]|uniref:SMP-30/Gluconolactonase/LRE-like region domain-containing protein n=1 Tax=Gnomoniopsis smithogilvyi TaxID=1191159 RepID=A0A9W9CWI1_9PEZI|nr:hypothetical protein N0V93_007284 [Gnomoniopsis smithogilvyi]